MRISVILFARYHLKEAAPPEVIKRVKVAVIGTPNVGKSSLTNKLVRNDICAVSKLIDTTRRNWITKLEEDSIQLEVVDSPGLIGVNHAKKVIETHTESKILVDPERAFRSAHHVLVVHDVTAPGSFIHHRVLHLLHRNSHIPASLVLNKVDLIKSKPQLLELASVLTNGVVKNVPIQTKKVNLGALGKHLNKTETLTVNPMVNFMEGKSDEWKENYNKIINKATHKCAWFETKKVFQTEKGWPHFENVFFVSCKSGEGIDGLRSTLKASAEAIKDENHSNSYEYKQKPNIIIAEHVRSAFMNSIPADVAYKLKSIITDFENLGTDINVTVDVICEKERWAQMVSKVVGSQTAELERNLSKLFHCHVHLQILPKFKGKLVVAE